MKQNILTISIVNNWFTCIYQLKQISWTFVSNVYLAVEYFGSLTSYFTTVQNITN